MIKAVREAAETFHELLQIILIEADYLVRHGQMNADAAARMVRLETAARRAAKLSLATWGQADERKTTDT